MNRLLAVGFLLLGLLGFSGAASADCSNSPAGSYCQSGQCPAGSYSAAGAAVCTPCAPGTFSSSPGSGGCTAVTSSYYLFGGSVATGTGFTGQAACPISTPGFRTYGANPVALGNYYGTNYPIAPNTTCLIDVTYPPCPAPNCLPPPTCISGTFLVTVNNRQYCAFAPRGAWATGVGGASLCPSGKTTASLGNSSSSACQ